jgi:CHAT domain-containing protein
MGWRKIISVLARAFAVGAILSACPARSQTEVPDTLDEVEEAINSTGLRADGATVGRMEKIVEQMEDALDDEDTATYAAAARRYLTAVDSLGGGDIGAMISCYSAYTASGALLGWKKLGDARDMIEWARRSCQRLRSTPPVLSLALDTRQGIILAQLDHPDLAAPFLSRGYAAARARKFRDDFAPQITFYHARSRIRAGKQREATEALLQLKQAVDVNPRAASARIDTLAALAQIARENGNVALAYRWAEEADRLVRADPALAKEHFSAVESRLAMLDWSLFGPLAAAPRYEELVADADRNWKSNPAIRAQYRLYAAWALAQGGELAEAKRLVTEAETIAKAGTLSGAERGEILTYLIGYYQTRQECGPWVANARAYRQLTQGTGLGPGERERSRFALAEALTSCGAGREALEILDRKIADDPAMEASRRWHRARAYLLGGDAAAAVGEQRSACVGYRTNSLAALTRRSSLPWSADNLFETAAACNRSLASTIWAAAKPADAGGVEPAVLKEAFEQAQLGAQSDGDDGVSLVAATSAAERRGPEIGDLVRAYEEKSLALARRQWEFEAIPSEAAGSSIQWEQDISQVRDEIERLRGQISAKFPEYWSLRSPAAATLESLTGGPRAKPLLAEGEALILVSIPDYDEPGGLVFAVSRHGTAVGRVGLTQSKLTELATQLRRQIQQPTLTDDSAGPAPAAPFDRDSAWRLHQALFGDPALQAVLAKANTLLVVTSDPLKEIPFGVLVTRKPEGNVVASDPASLRGTAWLLREKAVTVFPSVASLVALRSTAPAVQQVRKPFLAFADPQFAAAPPSGGDSGGSYRSAGAARTGFPVLRDLAGQGRAEMEGIARILGASEDSVLTGPAASEDALKRLANDGTLRGYRVLGFATHGLVPGDASSLREPALALSEPTSGKEDGILRASEISAMSLSADVILLSACNTGTLRQSRSLIGLSRAFLRGGARATVVTFWSVRNDVGARILPAAFAATRADPKLSLAQALRLASLRMLDDPSFDGAHPAQWAAYTMVGDGR